MLCRDRHLRKGLQLQPSKLRGGPKGQKPENGGPGFFLPHRSKAPNCVGLAELTCLICTFALEGCLLYEQLIGSLILFDFSECDCSGLESTFLDSSGHRCAFARYFLGMEVFLAWFF